MAAALSDLTLLFLSENGTAVAGGRGDSLPEPTAPRYPFLYICVKQRRACAHPQQCDDDTGLFFSLFLLLPQM